MNFPIPMGLCPRTSPTTYSGVDLGMSALSSSLFFPVYPMSILWGYHQVIYGFRGTIWISWSSMNSHIMRTAWDLLLSIWNCCSLWHCSTSNCSDIRYWHFEVNWHHRYLMKHQDHVQRETGEFERTTCFSYRLPGEGVGIGGGCGEIMIPNISLKSGRILHDEDSCKFIGAEKQKKFRWHLNIKWIELLIRQISPAGP